MEFKKKIVSKYPCKFKHRDFSKSFISKHRGVTDGSNWLFKRIVLMSDYPFEKSETKGKEKLDKLMKEGQVNVFVNLMTKKEKKRFTPYENHAKEINKEVEFLYCPIKDGFTTSMEKIKEIISEIIKMIKKKRVVLIHCFGGHGRTGTLSACLIAEIEKDLMLSDVLQYVEAVHDTRIKNNSHAPQNHNQICFIAKFLGKKRCDINYLLESCFKEKEKAKNL